MKLIGFVKFVTEKTDKSKKADKVFFTQELGLHMKDEINGQVFENFAKIQYNGDRCDCLIPLSIGDKIEVECSVKGSLQTKEDSKPTSRNPKSEDIYTNLNGINVIVLEKTTIVENTNIASGNNTNTTNNNSTKPSMPKKPEIMPEGYVWDDAKGLIPEVPF